VQPRELDDVFADQVDGVLVAPALGRVIAIGELRLREASALQQPVQRGIGRLLLLFTPLAHGNRMQAQRQIPAD